jgi:predicted nuclease of predicted toxin-antitoxin system
MNSLFIELYLDEDVNVLVRDLIRAKGFSVTTVRDEGKLQKSDSEQLIYAVNSRKTLVTHNRADFEKLIQEYFNQEKTHYGVIIAVRHPPQEIARRLLKILNNITADEMINQVRYI